MARGGKRAGAGRPAGAKTKTGAELREAAQAFTDDALKVFAEIMADIKQPAAARVSAASAILDRGHGKPKQELDLDGNIRAQVSVIELVGVRPG